MWDAETRRAWSRAHYLKNIEKRRAAQCASYKKHRQKRLEYDRAYNKTHTKERAAYFRKYNAARRVQRVEYVRTWRLKNPASAVLISAKQRAKRLKLPFSLAITDITVPEFCPVLGIRLQHSEISGRAWAASPSLDRKIPSLGYVPGNVAVISWRANIIKGDATPEELRAVAAWVSK